MGILSKAVQGFKSGESYRMESLDIDVMVCKMTVKQAKALQAFQKKHNIKEEENDFSKNAVMIEFILKNFFKDESGNPLLEDGEESIVDDLTVDAIQELTEAFSKVNKLNMNNEELVEDAKKK